MPGLSCVGIQLRLRMAFALAEQIGLLAARGLRGSEPLQCLGVGTACGT